MVGECFDRVAIRAQQLQVANLVLQSVERGTAYRSHLVVVVALRLNAVKLELPCCSATSAAQPQDFLELLLHTPRPDDLSRCHGSASNIPAG